MDDEFEMIISDEDFKNSEIDLLDIELNIPISEEDIRYIELEDKLKTWEPAQRYSYLWIV